MIASRLQRALATASLALAFAAAPVTIHAGFQASVVAAKEAESGGKHAEPGDDKGGQKGGKTGGTNTGKTSGGKSSGSKSGKSSDDKGGKKSDDKGGKKSDDKGGKTGSKQAGDDNPGAHSQNGKKK